MDLTFETENGKSFTIKVGSSDTIAEVKQKIQKHQKIPVNQQTLFYHDSLLWDESTIEGSMLFHRARVRLLIADNTHRLKPSSAPSSSEHVRVFLLLPSGKILISNPMRKLTTEHIRKLLEMGKVQDKVELPEEYFLVHNRYVMEEQDSIESLGVMEGDSIEIIPLRFKSLFLRSYYCYNPSSPWETMCALLLLPDGTLVIFKPKLAQKIQELRKDLERYKKEGKFDLPDEYFFVHKHYVMDEKESLEGLRVDEGNSGIYIVQGRAPSPSSFSSDMIRVIFQFSNGKKLVLNAKGTMKVEEMRRELEKATKDAKFELAEPYFFVYNRTRMKEKQSLEWHGVQYCDSIMIFPGTLLPYHTKP